MAGEPFISIASQRFGVFNDKARDSCLSWNCKQNDCQRSEHGIEEWSPHPLPPYV